MLKAEEVDGDGLSENSDYVDAQDCLPGRQQNLYGGDEEDPIVLSDSENDAQTSQKRGQAASTGPIEKPQRSSTSSKALAEEMPSQHEEQQQEAENVRDDESSEQDQDECIEEAVDDAALSLQHSYGLPTQVHQATNEDNLSSSFEDQKHKEITSFQAPVQRVHSLQNGIRELTGNALNIDLQDNYQSSPSLLRARTASKDLSGLSTTGDDPQSQSASLDPLWAKISALPPAAQVYVHAHFKHHCGVCRKYFHLQPWTEFDQKYMPMCTNCSWVALEISRSEGHMSWMIAAVRKQDQYKYLGKLNSIQQNMDPDVPINTVSLEPEESSDPDTNVTPPQGFNDQYLKHGYGSYDRLLNGPIAPSHYENGSAAQPQVHASLANPAYGSSAQTARQAGSKHLAPVGMPSHMERGNSYGLPSPSNAVISYKSPYHEGNSTPGAQKRAIEAFEDDILDPRGSISPLAQYARDDFSESPPPEAEFRPRKIRCVESQIRRPRQPSPSEAEDSEDTMDESSTPDCNASREEDNELALAHSQSAQAMSDETDSSNDSDDEPLVVQKQRKRLNKESDDEDYEESDVEASEEEDGISDDG